MKFIKKLFIISILIFLSSCSSVVDNSTNQVKNKNNDSQNNENLNETFIKIKYTENIDEIWENFVLCKIISKYDNLVDEQNQKVKVLEVFVIKNYNSIYGVDTDYSKYVDSLGDKKIKIIVNDYFYDAFTIDDEFLYRLNEDVILSSDNEKYNAFDSRSNEETLLPKGKNEFLKLSTIACANPSTKYNYQETKVLMARNNFYLRDLIKVIVDDYYNFVIYENFDLSKIEKIIECAFKLKNEYFKVNSTTFYNELYDVYQDKVKNRSSYFIEFEGNNNYVITLSQSAIYSSKEYKLEDFAEYGVISLEEIEPDKYEVAKKIIAGEEVEEQLDLNTYYRRLLVSFPEESKHNLTQAFKSIEMENPDVLYIEPYNIKKVDVSPEYYDTYVKDIDISNYVKLRIVDNNKKYYCNDLEKDLNVFECVIIKSYNDSIGLTNELNFNSGDKIKFILKNEFNDYFNIGDEFICQLAENKVIENDDLLFIDMTEKMETMMPIINNSLMYHFFNEAYFVSDDIICWFNNVDLHYMSFQKAIMHLEEGGFVDFYNKFFYFGDDISNFENAIKMIQYNKNADNMQMYDEFDYHYIRRQLDLGNIENLLK